MAKMLPLPAILNQHNLNMYFISIVVSLVDVRLLFFGSAKVSVLSRGA